jgi:hypothetical protein
MELDWLTVSPLCSVNPSDTSLAAPGEATKVPKPRKVEKLLKFQKVVVDLPYIRLSYNFLAFGQKGGNNLTKQPTHICSA